jgi:hypothetical protein
MEEIIMEPSQVPVIPASGEPPAAGTAVVPKVDLPESVGTLAGGDDMRDHDFPTPPTPDLPAEECVTVDQGEMDPEQIFAGGLPGEVEGDTQPVGEVPTIMDQDEATPDFA